MPLYPGGGGSGSISDQSITGRMVHLGASAVAVATLETTTSTSFTNLATSGPAVTLSPGVTQDHLLTWSSQNYTDTGGAYAITSVAIAGAAAAEEDATYNRNYNVTGAQGWSRTKLAAAQSSGATHTVKYRVSANTGTFQNREIIGIPV